MMWKETHCGAATIELITYSDHFKDSLETTQALSSVSHLVLLSRGAVTSDLGAILLELSA